MFIPPLGATSKKKTSMINRWGHGRWEKVHSQQRQPAFRFCRPTFRPFTCWFEMVLSCEGRELDLVGRGRILYWDIFVLGHFPYLVCRNWVGPNSTFCNGCSHWIHKKCSRICGRLKPLSSVTTGAPTQIWDKSANPASHILKLTALPLCLSISLSPSPPVFL